MDRHGTILVGTERLLLDGLERALPPEFTVVAKPVTIESLFVRPIESWRADLLLVVGWGAVGGVSAEALTKVRELQPSIRITVVATDTDVEALSSAMAANVDGYLSREMGIEALHCALRLIMLGEQTRVGSLAIMGRRNGVAASLTEDCPQLSLTENCVLRLLAEGQPNKLIARHMHITEGTVKVHVRKVLRRIGARNRTQAAIWALSRGRATAAAAQDL